MSDLVSFPYGEAKVILGELRDAHALDQLPVGELVRGFGNQLDERSRFGNGRACVSRRHVWDQN